MAAFLFVGMADWFKVNGLKFVGLLLSKNHFQSIQIFIFHFATE